MCRKIVIFKWFRYIENNIEFTYCILKGFELDVQNLLKLLISILFIFFERFKNKINLISRVYFTGYTIRLRAVKTSSFSKVVDFIASVGISVLHDQDITLLIPVF